MEFTEVTARDMTFEGYNKELMKLRFAMHEASKLMAVLSQSQVHCNRWDESLPRTSVEALISSVDQLINDHSVPNARQIGEIVVRREDAGSIELWVSRRTLQSIVRLLNDVINGFVIWEWEFHTLVGYNRSETRQILHQLHWYVVTPERDLLNGQECPYA